MKLREQFKHGDVVQVLDAPKGANTGTVVSVGTKYVQVSRAGGWTNARLVMGYRAENLRKITV